MEVFASVRLSTTMPVEVEHSHSQGLVVAALQLSTPNEPLAFSNEVELEGVCIPAGTEVVSVQGCQRPEPSLDDIMALPLPWSMLVRQGAFRSQATFEKNGVEHSRETPEEPVTAPDC